MLPATQTILPHESFHADPLVLPLEHVIPAHHNAATVIFASDCPLMATSKVSATTFLMALCLLQTPLVRSQATRKGELSARQIAQKTFPSVVILIAEDRSGSYLGSGFFVDSDVVATNYHVIKGAAKITARRV